MSRANRRFAKSKQHAPLLEAFEGPELVIGLIGPIGTNLRLVSEILCDELKKVQYNTVEIHVSQLMSQLNHGIKLVQSPQEERYLSYIKAGNTIRRKLERHDGLALLSVAAIQRARKKTSGAHDTPIPRTAFILNQLKRPEEVETLRKIYGRGFIAVSSYCSKKHRIDSLTSKIADSHANDRRKSHYEPMALNLILTDLAEEEDEYGQRVQDTFPLADVIIDAETDNSIRSTVSRFIRSFFNDYFISPSKDEFFMHLARQVSYRSADLSRQVGAVIVAEKGEILTSGCNEVPKAGGGAYWESDEGDTRDFTLGYDSSVKMKTQILQDIFRRLKPVALKKELRGKSIDELVEMALFGKEKPYLKDSLLMDLLEHGRIVHAEMSAITDAARIGVPLKNSTLYCTTFPCHICARHIVSSGIRRVVYLEPYQKSLVTELYPDSIEIVGELAEVGTESIKVRFEPFVGIASERFAEIFKKRRRKDEKGNALKWEAHKARPIFNRFISAYTKIETATLVQFNAALETSGLHKL